MVTSFRQPRHFSTFLSVIFDKMCLKINRMELALQMSKESLPIVWSRSAVAVGFKDPEGIHFQDDNSEVYHEYIFFIDKHTIKIN